MAEHGYACRLLGAGVEGDAITRWRSSGTGSVVFRARG
jgi:hypothetical protein